MRLGEFTSRHTNAWECGITHGNWIILHGSSLFISTPPEIPFTSISHAQISAQSCPGLLRVFRKECVFYLDELIGLALFP